MFMAPDWQGRRNMSHPWAPPILMPVISVKISDSRVGRESDSSVPTEKEGTHPEAPCQSQDQGPVVQLSRIREELLGNTVRVGSSLEVVHTHTHTHMPQPLRARTQQSTDRRLVGGLRGLAIAFFGLGNNTRAHQANQPHISLFWVMPGRSRSTRRVISSSSASCA